VHVLGVERHLAQGAGGLLELLVLKELVDEFPARVEVVLLGVGVDGLLVLGRSMRLLISIKVAAMTKNSPATSTWRSLRA